MAGAPEPVDLVSTAAVVGLDGLTAIYAYGANTRRILLAAKNGGRRDLLRCFGARLHLPAGLEVDAVTWVPASRQGRSRRGYDQGRVMARAFAAELGVPTRHLLARRGRRNQAGATRRDRLRGPELVGIGRCPPRVAVVDDVLTTGSSLAVAATVLRGRGGSVVVGAVAAVAGGMSPAGPERRGGDRPPGRGSFPAR
jgi:predicted amidophosphoribosyltransferase